MASDQEIAKGVESVLRQSDPNAVNTVHGVVQQLEAKLGLDLSHKATFIRDQINLLLRAHSHPPPPPPPQQPKEHFALQHHYAQFPPHFALQQLQQQQQQQQLHHQHHHQQQQHIYRQAEDLNFGHPLQSPPQQQHQHQSHHAQSQHQPPPEAPVAAKRKAKNAGSNSSGGPNDGAPAKRRGGPGGLNKLCGVSPELQAIVGEPNLSRTEIVKQLWVYIRKNNLQDPSNKRKIICDDALRLVFEVDCTDMFKMNKLLSKHIIRLEPPKEPQTKRLKLDVESAPESSEKAEPGPRPVLISEALANFLGTAEREMLQTEALRRVWEYIKLNQLEDPLNPMAILCDMKLQELLGCESISAVGIPEMLARRHLFKQ